MYERKLFNNKIKNQKLLLTIQILFILFLIIVNSLIASYLRTNLLEVAWESDDGLNLSVAENFRKTGKFFFDTTSFYLPRLSVQQLIDIYPSAEYPMAVKGPLYFLALGGFLELINPPLEELWLTGSYFNNILSSFFLVLFFFLVKKKFGLFPAMMSTSLILFVPWFGWFSTRIFLYSLLFILMVIPFFFFGKKRTEYLVTGLFFGLAYLTHPFGLYTILSYNIFLLLHREFKGLLISNLIGIVIFIPWFMRNYYYFKDVGWGLYLPLTDKLSNYLSFLPTISDDITYLPKNYADSYAKIDFNTLTQPFLPFDVFGGIFNEMFSFFHIGLLTIFIIVFAGFSFISFKNLSRNSVKKGLIYFSIVVILYLVVWQISEDTLQSISQDKDITRESYALSYDAKLVLQVFFVFIFPIILILLFYKFSNNFLENTSRFQKFILISSFVTMIIIYLYSLNSGRLVPSSKHFLFQLFLLLPLAIVGAEKVFTVILIRLNFDNHALSSTIFRNISTRKVSYLILISLSVFFIIDMSYGLENINSYILTLTVENNDTKIINDFINNEIDPNAIVGTNKPFIISLKTDLTSVILPWYHNQAQFDRYIEYYNIDYLVFYYLESDHYRNPWNELKNHVLSWDFSDYYFEEEFFMGKSSIIKVLNILDADISDPVAYAKKSIKLEKIGNVYESKKIMDEFKEFQLDDPKILHKICNVFIEAEKFSISQIQCENILNVNPNDLVAHSKLLFIRINLASLEDPINTNFIYSDINNILFMKNKNPESRESITELIDTSINKSIYLENDEQYLGVLEYLDISDNISMFELDSNLIKLHLSSERSDYDTLQKSCNELNDIFSFQLNDFHRFNFPSHVGEINDFSEYLNICYLNYFEQTRLDILDVDVFVDRHKSFTSLLIKLIEMPEVKNHSKLLNEFEYNSGLRDIAQQEFINYLVFSSDNLLSLQKNREAERTIDIAISEDRFNPTLWAQKGKILESSGNFIQALDAYEFAKKYSQDKKYDEKIIELKEMI